MVYWVYWQPWPAAPDADAIFNLSGQVLCEQVGGKQREVLAADLAGIFTRLAPRLLE